MQRVNSPPSWFTKLLLQGHGRFLQNSANVELHVAFWASTFEQSQSQRVSLISAVSLSDKRQNLMLTSSEGADLSWFYCSLLHLCFPSSSRGQILSKFARLKVAVEACELSHGSSLYCDVCRRAWMNIYSITENDDRKRDIGLALLSSHRHRPQSVQPYMKSVKCGDCVCMCVFAVCSCCLHPPPPPPHCVGEQSSKSSSSLTSLSPNCALLYRLTV